MKKLNLKIAISLGVLSSTVLFSQACSQLQSMAGGQGGGSSSQSSELPKDQVAAGNGAAFTGTGSLSVPTADGVVARLTNGLQGNVSPLAGNFAKSLAQVRSNLPKVTDPSKASGYDQAQLLVYAACSDLTTGTAPLMLSKYGVDPKQTITAETSTLMAAGMTMLNQYTANLASQSAATPAINTAFSTLLTAVQADTAPTTTTAFMSVCMAANTAGTTLLGM